MFARLVDRSASEVLKAHCRLPLDERRVFAASVQTDASTDGKTRCFVYTNSKSTDWGMGNGVRQSEIDRWKNFARHCAWAQRHDGRHRGRVVDDDPKPRGALGPGSLEKHELAALAITVRIELKGYQCSASTKDVFDSSVTFLGSDPGGQPASAAKPGVTNAAARATTSGRFRSRSAHRSAPRKSIRRGAVKRSPIETTMQPCAPCRAPTVYS